MAYDTWTIETQRLTLANATRWGHGWTTTDLAFVTAFSDDATNAELALATGRTLFAIQTIKSAIRAGRVTPSNVVRTRRVERPTTTCPDCHLVRSVTGVCAC